ncbi:HlyD family efflux transporter periplasmic adaptor subunit [Alisedimentitalea sp. MJ-SS2]|uniref:efflux RND transporter periplasmic adaptor subunit n=1 Tax=Aliisedimentitalea sp. MJ-SS2 TaxID=3049795 RepID=UPI00290DF11E|nr:HlyD family efflux transporter periplasmic adaptor subunit [Alisedimentitalea sp. MJ-SS2]MDU8926333.1 HlyD family efflux transporter periplasmic adaptor subunit [Alisedimentitalea sp. MJ-SS2]
MSGAIRIILRLLAFTIPVLLGALTVAFSENLKQPPAAKEKKRPPTAVRVITMAPVELLPRVSGFGTVTPAREWRAVARVEGEVIETAPNLANGEVATSGSVLLRLDDTDLQLSLTQIDAQIAALAIKDKTLAATQDIVAADLELSRAELARQEKLASEGVATQTRLDTARRAELAARAKVVEVENLLALNAAERDVLAAQRSAVERSLEFAEIRAPYDIRIGEVSAELGQFVTRGQTLVMAEGIEAAEVAAQFSIGRIGPLLRAAQDGSTVLDLKARVRLTAPGHSVIWKARVDRVGEAIDPRTQSTAIVVRIDDPYGQAEVGKRPPLRRNTFVEVILMAPKRPALVAPVDAVRGGKALVVSTEGTLEKRAVKIGYTVGGIAVVSDGLAEGDKLVVSDPSVAVPGMKVKPVEDKKLLSQITATASGQARDKSKGTK